MMCSCWNLAAVLQEGGHTCAGEQRVGGVQENYPATTPIPPMEDPTGTPVGQQLQDDMIVFLQQWPWEWFLSLTFRQSAHPEAADKQFRRFVMQLNRVLYHQRWLKHDQGIRWVQALEYNRQGAIHYHALFTGVSGLRPHDCAALWHKHAGFARIEAIRNTVAVLRYISKGVPRGGELDFEPRMRAPQL